MIFRRVYAFGLALLGTFSADAEIHFGLTLRRESMPAYAPGYGQVRFYAWPTLSATPAPQSYHRVDGPNNSCVVNFGTNDSSSSFVYTTAADLFAALTNGSWTVTLNRETPQEESYTFTLDLGALDTNELSGVRIFAPANGGINVASNSAFYWTGPSNLQTLQVSLRYSATNLLTPSQTNWTTAPLLAPGTNFFSVAYSSNVTTLCTMSEPTNVLNGELADWSVTAIQIETKTESGFIAEGLPESSLAAALNAPGMIWETAGAANWFAQSTNTTDGAAAAQSGVIADDSMTTLRTVIYGSNTISFMWRSDCEGWADYIEFSDNGNYVTDLTGINAWENFTHQLTDNVVHVLEWTYHKDTSDTEGADAAYLDQVRLGDNSLPVGPPLSFGITVVREKSSVLDLITPGQTTFRALLHLTTTETPLSYHQIISPGGWFSTTFGPTNTSVNSTTYPSIEELAPKLTNGLWTLWLNRQTPQAQFYQFAVNSTGPLTSNLAPAINPLTPPDGLNGIANHVRYSWSGGWESPAETFVSVADCNGMTPSVYASENLALTTITNWDNGPLLTFGTNIFFVRQDQILTNIFGITPIFLGWTFEPGRISSRALSEFTVSNAAPADLLNPRQVGSSFQFDFQTQFGFTNVIQSRTNLAEGAWVDRTNLLGDGTSRTAGFPIGLLPAEFFRIISQ